MSRRKNNTYLGTSTIMYPVFLECSNIGDDIYWKKFFNDLSIGRCPKSIYINNDFILSSNRKYPFSFNIPTTYTKEDVINIYNNLKRLLLENTDICSDNDIKLKNEEMIKTHKEITNDTQWSDIKKKHTKEILILNFVVDMKNVYDLNNCAMRHLFSLITLSFLYKTHTSKDIIFENKKILQIKDIIYDNKVGYFINLRDNINERNYIDIEDKVKKHLFLFYKTA